MKVWISRNSGPYQNYIYFWSKKPRKYKDKGLNRIEYGFIKDEEREKVDILEINIVDFNKFFGYFPEEGSCEKVDIRYKKKNFFFR